MEIERQMEKGVKFPFDKITQLNIGNPQVLGQKPFTFIREVLACCISDTPKNKEIYSKDVIDRADSYLSKIGNRAVGAYTDSPGFRTVIKEVEAFIEKRDNVEVDPSHIYLVNGASEGIATILRLILSDPEDGVMIPIPQYPIYSALITKFGGNIVGYYLDEETGWSLSVKELERSYKEATQNGTKIRGIVVINPGNPTGQVLEEENMKEVLQFAHKKNIMFLADEVYQRNIYVDKTFCSARKALKNLGEPYNSELELCSFHSLSKGLLGECGLRGGYMECHNFDKYALEQVYKAKAVNLCSNSIGQIGIGLMVNPPTEETASPETVEQYKEEEKATFEGLQTRAKLLTTRLNAIAGITCTELEGAMYAFPKINFPQGYIAKALAEGKKPDLKYCLDVLEETGIMIVPGSGFGQKEGTYHFRITNLISTTEEMDKALDKLEKITNRIMNE